MADDKRLICESAALTDGGDGVRFTVTIHNATMPAFAVRHDGQVHGFINRCAHVGVELDWQEGRFFDTGGEYLVCATHGALYAPETGVCVAGPCRGGALIRLDVLEEDGRVYWQPENGTAT